MQSSKVDSFVKTQKQHKRMDDGTGKRQDSKRGSFNKPVHNKKQEY
jgi:hypothetical protein